MTASLRALGLLIACAVRSAQDYCAATDSPRRRVWNGRTLATIFAVADCWCMGNIQLDLNGHGEPVVVVFFCCVLWHVTVDSRAQ